MLSNLWIEEKYVNLLSVNLDRFAKRGNAYNFRCPICGDSKTSKFRARGYIYQKSGKLLYRCHNCGYGTTFTSLLKRVNPALYDEFRLEMLKEMGGPSIRPERKKEENKNTDRTIIPTGILSGMQRIIDLSPDHPVRRYVKSRHIPDQAMEDLYYVTRFMEWINSVIPGKFDDRQLRMDEPRLVIPFLDANENVVAVTGRSFKKKSVKYLTVKFDDSVDKLFGMDRIDPTKRVYIVEGPIDSLFISNSIAFAGSSGNIPKFDDYVIVLDNEPRNKEITKLMDRFINEGHRVCIWPSSIKFKDINDMIMSGMTEDEIKKVIDDNTFSGLSAKVKLSEFRNMR